MEPARLWRSVLGLLCVLLLVSCIGGDEKIRIASGTQGSVVHRLGTALADTFNKHVDDVEVSVVEGAETRESLTTLLKGEAELAVAFSDTEGDGDIRTLVPLYELYLYIIVWEDSGIEEVPDLRGRRVGIGPKGSGTETVSRRLLSHYGFDEEQLSLVMEGYRDTTNAFLKKELDAVFLLGSIESKAVARMLEAPGTRLMSLDDPERIAPAMEGIRSKHPFVVSHVIPKHLFGDKPTESTGVIGVHALLVARADLSEDTARELTRAVFAHKVELGQSIARLRELDERFEPHLLRFPLHPGAAQYYRRDEPPVIVQWAETISLGITVMVLGWSGLAAIAAARRRRRKGMLDELFADFQNVVHTYDEEHETPPDEMSDDQLQSIREELQTLRRRSFGALMSGRIEASNSFVVFNDYLRWELQEIERIQRARRLERRGEAVEAEA